MQKEDLRQLAEIYSIVYQKFDIEERWTSESAKRLLSYWFDKQPDLAFVAEFNGKVVGAFIAGIKPWWDGNHLSDGEIFVHPDYQKKGIATKLSVALYEKALQKYNVISFDAYTFKKTKFPLSWYLSQGFVQNKEWIMISGDVKGIVSKLKRK
ncbi:GNAT family N-acetyltransferase [Candidatus Woesearchaeota archaeon]|nr:GNAT family N-acetyltransferase [Candidatus Woesearchaeota archaeon]